MPIYEFRCTRCGHIEEFLFTGSSQEVDMKCRECQCEELERVMSRVSFSVGGSGGGAARPRATERTCGPGKSCTTIELPGHTR